MNKIKELRVERGMSQNELSTKVGISRPYLSKLENNDDAVKNCSLQLLYNIALVLEVNIKAILNDLQ